MMPGQAAQGRPFKTASVHANFRRCIPRKADTGRAHGLPSLLVPRLMQGYPNSRIQFVSRGAQHPVPTIPWLWPGVVQGFVPAMISEVEEIKIWISSYSQR